MSEPPFYPINGCYTSFAKNSVSFFLMDSW